MNAVGDVVDGRFELIEQLGSGGMGTVWRARDTVLHRDVALKAVRPDAAASEAVRERVLREARALARLSHPHVVTVHHIVDVDPHPWIVMELVPGVSLQDRLDKGPMTPVEAARLGRQVLSALHAAHTAGIQHRDVKPPNILLRPDGSAVLTDFGIAALHDATALTLTGELVGSPEYMAPERIRGHNDDPASDLWSLGLVLYVCAEGVSPLRRATSLATLAAVIDDPVPPPLRSGPLAPVLEALLVRDPAARPDAARLDTMLAQVEAGTAQWERRAPTAVLPAPPVGHTPTQLNSPRPPDARGRRRNRTRIAVAVTAVLAVAAAGLLFLNLRGDSGDAEEAGTGSGSGSPSGGASEPEAAPTGPTPSAPSSAPASGRWIAQLFSEPVSSGTAARDARLAEVRKSVPEAVFLRSDDYASLSTGYWVIYAPGPFTDGGAALSYCGEHGRTAGNTCIGRYLSTSSADYDLQCHPPASAPTGRCTRS